MPVLGGFDDAGEAEPPFESASDGPPSPVGGAPPWGDPSGADALPPPMNQSGFNSFPDEVDDRNTAEKKAGAFMSGIDGPVTRQQALEYINLQRWAREGCSTFIFVSLLWLSFLVFMHVHSHIAVSFEEYRDVTEDVQSFSAKASRGIAPKAIFSAAGESKCSCACPALCSTGKVPGGHSLVGVPAGAPLFNGTVLPEQLQTMRAKAEYLRSLGQPEKTRRLSEVNSIEDVWFWLQHGLVPELWHEEDRSAPVSSTMLFGTTEVLAAVKNNLGATEKPGRFMRWNQVIGGVRLRQRRLHPGDCRADQSIDVAASQRCHKQRESVIPFGPGTQAYAKGFVPDEKEKGAFDIYLDTERPVHIALETLQFMLQAHNWLDASSRSLQVQVPIFNVDATPALFGLLEIRFDFTRSGDLNKKVDLWTAAANPYFGFNIMYAADVVFLILMSYLLIKKTYQVVKHLLTPRCFERHERHDVLCNFWFIFDWVTLACGCFGVGGWAYIVSETSGIGEAVTALPKTPAFDAPEKLVDNYHAAWGEVVDRILMLTVWRERLRLAGFGYGLMLIFQFIKAFRGQPKMAQLTRTLINAFEDLLHFVACFVVLFLSFAFTGHLVYGLRLEEWSSSTKCVNAAFRALRGDVNLPGMYEIAPITTIVWFWLFLVINIFIMMNLLLATVYDHFQLVKGKANAFTGILLQTKDALTDIWHREGCKIFVCRCCCRCRKRDDFPSHTDMLEELMRIADYNPKEKHHVFRTVLGPKWMRKKLEKHVFAGEVSADHIKTDELAPAEGDLKQFGVDQEYYTNLLEAAANYREREFDPEEIHVNQMRELVTLCEIEMAHMRKRLDNCQGHMRFTTHTMARRLEALEKAVHQSLGDLVYLAGSAGVPDKKEHQAGDAAPRTQAAIAGTYQRVISHLGQGMVKKLQDERSAHQDQLATIHNSRQQNDSYARIHANARLANAFGPDEKKRLARKQNMKT